MSSGKRRPRKKKKNLRLLTLRSATALCLARMAGTRSSGRATHSRSLRRPKADAVQSSRENRVLGIGWDGMGWDGMGWDGMEWDQLGWVERTLDDMRRDGMRWDETPTAVECSRNDLSAILVMRTVPNAEGVTALTLTPCCMILHCHAAISPLHLSSSLKVRPRPSS